MRGPAKVRRRTARARDWRDARRRRRGRQRVRPSPPTLTLARPAQSAPPVAVWCALLLLFVTNVVTLLALTRLNMRFDQVRRRAATRVRVQVFTDT